MACLYGQLLSLRVCLIFVRYGLENDSKHLTVVQKRCTLFKQNISAHHFAKMAANMSLKAAEITVYTIYRQVKAENCL